MTLADTSAAPAAPARRGRFITLEGGEGAGKSTQIRHILKRLADSGVEALATREPGGSPHAERLREILLSGAAAPLGAAAEALLFSAARIDHLDHLIKPALAEGCWVICDRFADSTRAYQGALGNLDPRVILAMEAATLGDTRPDLTLVLDIDPEIGLRRAARRRRPGEPVDRFEGETLAFHQALRSVFRDIAGKEPHRCVLIDAARGEESVANEIWAAIEARLFSARMRARARGLRLDFGEPRP